ncbi:hypothetical protein LX15_004617 [Streptoalloteichus tenebrarius]|uniref:Uncharacterized protein n=1 Tax=Streptoalloteichus tenebrarius (strain ATCC 17920 / DSM 40477 / JCM 4838 / CBS 697.72 / NBRC 16177 / NCIMB 11028 / NRRL B-12390 / A12253. 1 / ISP 5477) TaxID=1933 RepID=A0ABT1HZD8_STRSD|nr:hypothetical protein [Streptoalloteichus tenebrarius]MCP2260897.1 hypothetical protein [Streptoalloteichus tenebrarius]BFF03342.1 hypothetical protein GCM10020241_50170 [Streptoalloteichus tenebrarius]
MIQRDGSERARDEETVVRGRDDGGRAVHAVHSAHVVHGDRAVRAVRVVRVDPADRADGGRRDGQADRAGPTVGLEASAEEPPGESPDRRETGRAPAADPDPAAGRAGDGQGEDEAEERDDAEDREDVDVLDAGVGVGVEVSVEAVEAVEVVGWAAAFASAEQEVAERLHDEVQHQRTRARREHTDDLVDRYRPASLNVYTVHGDMAGRDIRHGRGVVGGRFALSVDETDLAALGEVFVAPPCVNRVRERLREPGLWVLTGPRGCGKATLATVLLGEVCGTNLRLLGRLADLATLGVGVSADAPTPAGTGPPRGVLAVDLDPQRAARTDEHTFRRLDKEARAHNVRLVLTVAGDLPAHHRVPAERVVEVDAPPARDVVTAHLLAMGAWERARTLLARDDEIAELFEQRCAGQPDVGDLAELARVLATSPEEGAGARLAETVLLQVRRWLTELPAADLPFLLGTVICHDLGYTVAMEITEDLLRRMRAPRPPAGLDQSRTARAHRLRAGFVLDWRNGDLGRVPVEIVRWERPREAAAVVRLLWAEMDRARPALLRWLHNLGRHPSWLVRDSVAAVVGVLMSEDFDVVREAVLEPWATSPDRAQRETALTALELVAADPRLTDVVERIVERWARGSQEQRWTAIRAYGGPLGRTSFDTALTCLDILAGSDERSLRPAVVDGVAELVDKADSEQLHEIMAMIDDWVRSPRKERHMTGVLTMMAVSIEQAQVGAARAPVLLTWADDDDRAREVLAALWRRLLNASFCHYVTRDVLTTWARTCEGDHEACGALARLLAEVVRSSRDLAILQLVARSWLRPGPTPWFWRQVEPGTRCAPPEFRSAAPNASAAVLAHLPRRAPHAQLPARSTRPSFPPRRPSG